MKFERSGRRTRRGPAVYISRRNSEHVDPVQSGLSPAEFTCSSITTFFTLHHMYTRKSVLSRAQTAHAQLPTKAIAITAHRSATRASLSLPARRPSAKLLALSAGDNGLKLAPSRIDHHLDGFAYMMYDTCEPKPAAKCSAYRQSCVPPVLKRRGPSTGSLSR